MVAANPLGGVITGYDEIVKGTNNKFVLWRESAD